MKGAAYLGLDLGGTGAKAAVFDTAGRLLGFGKRSHTPRISEDGRAEVPIEDVYAAARDAAREALSRAGTRVRALCIVSQGQTFVSLDDAGRPLHPAILWYDSRAAKQAERLALVLRKANPQGPVPAVHAIATAPKIMWLRERLPELMGRARRFLLLPDYVTYRLTGEAVTDPWTAGSTGLHALGQAGYSPEALAAAGIEEQQLARIQRAGTVAGAVSPPAADEWGLEADTPVAVGTNDQYAGALGAGNCQPGILSETTGTCLALVTLTTRAPDPVPPGLFVGPFPAEPYLYVLAYSKTAGLVLDWFRQELCPGLSLDELDRMAADVPVGSRGLTVLPHFDGAVSPVPDARLRGALWGLCLQHGRTDIYRAILESLAFCLRENLALLRDSGLRIEVVRAIGGGARSDVWLQIKADVTGLAVERPAVTEAAVLGAAMLAAVSCGEFESLQECCEALYRRDRVFEPDPGRRGLYEAPYARYLELHARLYG